MASLGNLTARVLDCHQSGVGAGTAAPALLERDPDLQALAAAAGQAAVGQGRIALISGEAGIGKTTFVERFIATSGRAMRVLEGHCDALSTPSPLAPLHDIARQTDGRLLAQLAGDAPRAALFSALLDQISESAQPTLLVIEDIHWADDATLDLIKFLSRRIAAVRVLLVVTYRDDEGGAQHPLRLLLGDLAVSRTTLRIALRRLTVDAVRTLVGGRALDAEALHRQTAGNPFFLTELIAHAGTGIPGSVRDAVLARAEALGPAARSVLETAAVIGRRMDFVLLESIAGDNVEGLALCLRAGLLDASAGVIAFRHELVRDAVRADLDPARSRDLHRQVLQALLASRSGRGDLAQLAHFAVGAGDAEAVFAFGPEAARAAAEMGAHRAAATQYRHVLDVAGDRPPADRARLLDAYAEECSIIDALAEATGARREAAALWQQEGDRIRLGESLAAMAWPLVRSARNADAEDASHRSIDVLEQMPPTPQLAAAYRIRAHLRMLDRDLAGAVHWGRKAIDLATRFQDPATIAAAEMVVGSALLVGGDDRGRPYLDRSLARARQAGLDALVGLIYLNLGSSYAEQYRFDDAERYLAEGIAYTAERDLDHANHYMCSWLALTRLYQGRWSEAEDIASGIAGRSNASVISRIMALVALGRVRLRRGDAGAAPLFDEALELALSTDTLQRLAPVRAARAEAAWFAGDYARVVAEAAATYALAARARHRWHVGEFSFWRWRVGERSTAPDWCAPPFLMQMEHDWQGAAAAWERLGCPYEQARALADGDAPARLAALEIFDRLGAGPAAAALRQRMRSEGALRIPRGPRAATRGSPFGLTRREMEILLCVSEGFSNAAIGARLFISPKTVDHHVSAVLAKLGAASRGEAARIARERQLLVQNGEPSPAK